MVRASLNYVTWKDRKEVVSGSEADLQSGDGGRSGAAIERVRGEVDQKYPAISRLWREHWERVIPFFAFPEEVRKVVYTTNAVESLHMSLRKIIKTRGSFPSEEAAFKLLYLALARVVAKWETVQNWKQMLNYLDTVCGDRIREAGVRHKASTVSEALYSVEAGQGDSHAVPSPRTPSSA